MRIQDAKIGRRVRDKRKYGVPESGVIKNVEMRREGGYVVTVEMDDSGYERFFQPRQIELCPQTFNRKSEIRQRSLDRSFASFDAEVTEIFDVIRDDRRARRAEISPELVESGNAVEILKAARRSLAKWDRGFELRLFGMVRELVEDEYLRSLVSMEKQNSHWEFIELTQPAMDRIKAAVLEHCGQPRRDEIDAMLGSVEYEG